MPTRGWCGAVNIRQMEIYSTGAVTYSSFEYYAMMLTAPVKIEVVVIYRPPGQMGETETLLSSIPEHACPMLLCRLPISDPLLWATVGLQSFISFLPATPLNISDQYYIQFRVSSSVTICNCSYCLLPLQLKESISHSLFLFCGICSYNLPALSLLLKLMMPQSHSVLHWALAWIAYCTVCFLSTNIRAPERKWHKTNNLSDLSEHSSRNYYYPFHPVSLLQKKLFTMTSHNATDIRKFFFTYLQTSPPAISLTADTVVAFFYWQICINLTSLLWPIHTGSSSELL